MTTRTKHSDQWFLATAPIFRALTHLCVPMAAAMLVGAVYNVVNSGFIGSLNDTALLAAITLGTPLMGIVMGVGGVFGTGGSALVSRLLGASEKNPAEADRIKHVTSFSLWGAVLTGIVLAILGLVFLDPLVALLGAQGAAVVPTTRYVAVFLLFVPVISAAMCLEQLVRAEGATRQVMFGLVMSSALNVVFDFLFILVFGWGVAGAALATGLANACVIAYFATWLTRRGAHVSLSPRWFTLSTDVVKPVFGVGVGELIQAGFIVVTSLVLNNLAAGYGNDPLAAMGVVVRIAQVPEFIVMGVTLGILPLLAYSFGKGDRARFGSALRASALVVGVFSVSAAVLLIVFRVPVLAFFSHDSSVIALGGTILVAQLVAMIANGFTGLLTTTFQATGRAAAATILATTQGVLFIPVVILFNLWFGLAGIIWALTFTECAALGIALVLWVVFRGRIHRDLDEAAHADPVPALTA